MRAESTGDEAETADKEDQHYESIEEAGGAKEDVYVGEHAGEDEERAGYGQEPAGGAAPIPKKNAHAEKHGNKRKAKSVGAEKAPEGTDHADLIGEKISADTGHDKAEEEMSEPAWSSPHVAERTIVHGWRIAEIFSGMARVAKSVTGESRRTAPSVAWLATSKESDVRHWMRLTYL